MLKFQPPRTILAEFATQRLASPRVLWVSKDRFSESAALGHAFCVPLGTEVDYLPEHRTQNADRYGGYGVGYCGGSARCGSYGDVQIKGVGLTPLVGSRPGAPVDPWHSSGTVTLNEAGREAIWSGICDAVLPFGAVPATALVLTGTRCQRTDSAPGVSILNRRALFMRTTALRPAHFLPNVHFSTPLVRETGVREDYLRVRKMIRALPDAFEDAFGSEVCGESATARVNSGMKAMARRFAWQVAAAFAKRLYHGSLNCTNIALDGRYVDFGTMTAVHAYRRQAGSPLWPDQWTQHSPLLRTLSSFLFHVGKHLDCPNIKMLLSTGELKAEFSTTLSNRAEMELLKQTGIPEVAIAAYPDARRRRTYRCIKDIYSRGADTSFVWRGDDDPAMVAVQPLQSLGRYDLNEIFAKAAPCHDSAQLRRTVSALIDDNGLAREFCEVYTDLMEWFLANHGGTAPAVLRVFLSRQAARLNADVSHLTRESLDTAMLVFEEDPSGMDEFIDRTVRHAREIVDDEPPELVDSNGRRIAGLNAQLEAVKHMTQRDVVALFAASPLQCLNAQANAGLGAPCATA